MNLLQLPTSFFIRSWFLLCSLQLHLCSWILCVCVLQAFNYIYMYVQILAKTTCQQSQNVLSIFLWICSSGYGVQVNVDLYDTSNEDLFPSQSSPYYLVLTCTFRSPVRAVTSGLSPSGLWHQSCHRQGCDIRALFDSGLLCQGLMIFFIKLFFSCGI